MYSSCCKKTEAKWRLELLGFSAILHPTRKHHTTHTGPWLGLKALTTLHVAYITEHFSMLQSDELFCGTDKQVLPQSISFVLQQYSVLHQHTSLSGYILAETQNVFFLMKRTDCSCVINPLQPTSASVVTQKELHFMQSAQWSPVKPERKESR